MVVDEEDGFLGAYLRSESGAAYTLVQVLRRRMPDSTEKKRSQDVYLAFMVRVEIPHPARDIGGGAQMSAKRLKFDHFARVYVYC